jgi:hypothetical protein
MQPSSPWRVLVVAFAALAGAASAASALPSCSGAASPDGAVSPDGGAGSPDADPPDVQADAIAPYPDAAPTVSCALDNGSDPVGLCTQKMVLRAVHEAAVAKAGVASGWDPKSFAPDHDDAGATIHDPRVAAAYGAAVARYHESSRTYGDDELTAALDADLVALAPGLVAALTPPPAGYSGELYADLRGAAAGLRYVDRDDLAAQLDAIAEAYGRAIHATYWVAIAPPPAGDAGAGGAGGGPPVEGPLGVLGVRDGVAVDYAPADVATGALALLDMAVRHVADEPANAAAWQSEARAALDRLHARARHATGLYYASLVTSADPEHDAIGAGADVGALLSDVQATIALAYLRAQELADGAPAALPALAGVPLAARSAALVDAANAPPVSLWDADQGGYLEGYLPASGARLATKTTRSNALFFAAIHRANLAVGSKQASQLMPLRSLLLDPLPAHAGLLSVVVGQDAYFARVPRGFDFDAADAGLGVDARRYSTLAVTAAVEGLTEQWHGLPGAPP